MISARILNLFVVLLLISYISLQSKAPFVQTNQLHQAKSQFQVNIIFNENRNFPILFAQFSKDYSRGFINDMVKGAFSQQPDIAFAVLVDCRQFQYNLNNTIGICYGFKDYKQEQTLSDQQKMQNDLFFRFQFLSPSPSRIKQKGHLLLKNHDSQNLRQLNNQFNSAFLAKVIRNQVPDFVSYIQQQYDMEQFLESKSSFRSSKLAKLLYFDQNLQAPLFLKKLAVKLDGRIKVGVTDSYKLLKKYGVQFDSIILLEYDFIKEGYQYQKIKYRQKKQLKDILSDSLIQKYLAFKKPRDMLLDFQHANYAIYNVSSLNQINQLISYGRVIFLQISSKQKQFQCLHLNDLAAKNDIFFNYICLNRQVMKPFLVINEKQQKQNTIFMIDSSLKQVIQINYKQDFNVYNILPRVAPRQKVSALSQMQLCIKTALSSNRDPVLYWYNQKTYKDVGKLLEYFNSLPQITSFIHFCQIYLPEDDVKKQFNLQQNSMFSLLNPDKHGQMQKFQYSNALSFQQIKMFLREMGINKILKVYQDKLTANKLAEIRTAEDLTKHCFNTNCIIGLMATNKFRLDKQMTVLKQLKLQFSQMQYSFYWIDGICHWDIAKQLKLIPKKQKLMDQSYIFYYKQKDNNYSLMKNIQNNKYWNKKDASKWLKSLKDPNNINRLRFGIDIEERKCEPIQQAQKAIKKKPQNQKKIVTEGEL